MLNSNEPIKVAHLQKLANQSMLNGALVNIISFGERARKLWSFDKARNVLIKKKKKKKTRDMGSEKYVLLDFAKYPSFSEVQKNSKVVNVWIRFQEELSLF